MNSSELLAEIVSAFKNEIYPGDNNIVYDNTGFHLECIEIRDAFMQQDWESVPDDVLSTESTGLAFMSKEGFKYYLPTYICAWLRDPNIINDGIGMIIHLLKLPTEIDIALMADKIHQYEVATQLPDVNLEEVLQNQLNYTNSDINRFIARVILFNHRQGQAIYHFLLYVRDESGDEFLSTEANIAIQRYWFQFS